MRVVIVGGGLSGLTLALTLHQQHPNANIKIFELRSPEYRTTGGLMLMPNALRILDRLGLYEEIAAIGFNYSSMKFLDVKGAFVDSLKAGDKERYGYNVIRIQRTILVDRLRDAVAQRNIDLKYNIRFERISGDNDGAAEVKVYFDDGSVEAADIVIAADGIHSAVRNQIKPAVQPVYNGHLALMATVTKDVATARARGEEPATRIYHGESGVLLSLPQVKSGVDVSLGVQFLYPDQDREGWKSLNDDKDKLYSMFTANKDAWPLSVQESLDLLQKENISIWPLYGLPEMATWTSHSSRVILIGDAAHAIPPTGGQGACQALEDGWTLAHVIGSSSPDDDSKLLAETIATWESRRRARIAKVRSFSQQLANNRLPQAEREKLPKGQYWRSDEEPELEWLFGHNAV